MSTNDIIFETMIECFYFKFLIFELIFRSFDLEVHKLIRIQMKIS